MNNAFDVGI